jgi:hypothetical protein
MKLGTKSILFGAHAFWLHPWFVARAWWKLYGFPWDPRLWVAFFVHDLGYWGKEHMDDEEGENHPLLGANIMHGFFDREWETRNMGPGTLHMQVTGPDWYPMGVVDSFSYQVRSRKWFNFVKYHSRFLSQRDGAVPSRLCYADKLAIALTPWWLYVPMVRATGEVGEYRSIAKHVEDIKKFGGEVPHPLDMSFESDKKWFLQLQAHMRRWVKENVNG